MTYYNCIPKWCEVTKADLRQMSDDNVREMYRQMSEDAHNEYTMDSSGNMVVVTTEQKRLIGNTFRGRGLK